MTLAPDGTSAPAPDGTSAPVPPADEPHRVLLHRTEAGLVPSQGVPDNAMADALRLLEDAAIRVDLDVAVRRASGERRVHSWQGLRGNSVASLSTVDGRSFELSRLTGDAWGRELTRTATVDQATSAATRTQAVPAVVDLPYVLLLATGEAFRRRRPDLIAQLGRRLGGGLRIDGAPLASDPTALLTALHSEALGRLRGLVRGSTGSTVGQVCWLRFPDGWRQLSGHTHGGERFARLERVDESRLGVEVARLATLLGARQ